MLPIMIQVLPSQAQRSASTMRSLHLRDELTHASAGLLLVPHSIQAQESTHARPCAGAREMEKSAI